MKKIVYVSGKMTGVKNYNFPEFNRVSQLLREKGYDVINPADFGANENWTWEDYMKKDIPEVLRADIVATLPNWFESRGASLEVFIANQVKIPVVDYEKLI